MEISRSTKYGFDNPEIFDTLVAAGRWCRETYFPLCAHLFLPDRLERALYLDADDLTNPDFLSGILGGVFNSGSYVINLKKMREAGIDISYYNSLTERLRNLKPEEKRNESVYFGDQGLLSAAFLGKLKYYVYPQIRDLGYCPYNFVLGYYDYFDQKPDYQPAIIHFAGVPFKPWKGRYPIFPNRFKTTGGTPYELSGLKPIQIEYYFLWLEYLFLTDQALTMLGFS